MLPIDDRLRAVARGQFSRLAQYEIEVENPLRPKEIQARIRAGETVEEIADAAGIPVERVRWFEGPVLAERGYVAQQAQTASVRRQGDSAPGPRLGEVVAERLTELGADPEDAQWDSRKHGDGSWQVQLAFRAGGRLHIAEWLFDPRRRHVLPADDNASRLSLPEAELPPPSGGSLGAATVTPIRPRPDRSQPALPPEPVMEPAEEPARAAAQAAAPGSFAPSRAPIGRPPSHAAPQPGSPRMPMSDDEPNGTGRGPAYRAGGAGRPAPGQGADDRNAGRTPAVATGSPAAQDRTEPSPAAQPAAVGQAAPVERAAPGPQGRPAADTDTAAAVAPSAERSPRPERAATGQAATGQAATGQAATGQAATGSGRYGTGRYGTGRHGTGRHGTGRHGTGRHGTGRHGTGRHRTGRHRTGRHRTGRHGTGRHGTGRYGSGRHGTGRCGTGRYGSGRCGTGRRGTGRRGDGRRCPGPGGARGRRARPGRPQCGQRPPAGPGSAAVRQTRGRSPGPRARQEGRGPARSARLRPLLGRDHAR